MIILFVLKLLTWVYKSGVYTVVGHKKNIIEIRKW